MERIDEALNLAELHPGGRLVDLGSGDGRVLLSAAKRGAQAVGYELDPGLASQARNLASRAGLEIEVIEGDYRQGILDADVVFAFLSPASMSRLRPQLSGLAPGSRVISVNYLIPGWEKQASVADCHLYRVPATEAAAPGVAGWTGDAVLIAPSAGMESMYPLTVGVGPGDVVIEVSPELSEFIHIHTGADAVERDSTVAVDVYCRAWPEDTAVAGTIRTREGEALALALVYTAGKSGWWRMRGSDASQKLREMVDEVHDGGGGAGAILAAAAERAGESPGAGAESPPDNQEGVSDAQRWQDRGR